MKNYILGITLLSCSLSVLAEPPSSEALIQHLSSCDATFFRAMKQESSVLENRGTLVQKGEIAYWKVPDRKVDENSVLMFSTPIDGKVQLLGYFDDIVDLESMGLYYSWGFLASGSPETIAKIIKPVVVDGNRLRRDGEIFVRSEIRNVAVSNGEWIKNDGLSSGTIPKNNTVERVFLLEEAGEKYPGVTRITCSLQGSVSAQLLTSERPDIGK